jgi:hypothetical protein
MIATSGKLPSTLVTSSSGAFRRPTECISSLPHGTDPSLSPKLSAHPHTATNGVTNKECHPLGMWSAYYDSICRIVLNFSYVFSFLHFFRLNKYYFNESYIVCRALPPPLSCHIPSPSTYSGAWLKPIHGLQNLGVTDFRLLLTLDMLGGLAQSQPKGRSTSGHHP